MTDKYPPGFEFMAEPTQEAPHRINGFARGDRVQVIEKGNRYYGLFGRVVNSWAGCHPEFCGADGFCKIIEVSIENTPPWSSYARSPVFNPKEITHVD